MHVQSVQNFYLVLCKFVTFLLRSSSWLLKLPVEQERGRRLLEGYLKIQLEACDRNCAATTVIRNETNGVKGRNEEN